MNEDQIGVWAGKIWHTLNEQGMLSIQELCDTTGLELKAIYSALGWLARESKVNFDDNDEVSLCFFNEQYY